MGGAALASAAGLGRRQQHRRRPETTVRITHAGSTVADVVYMHSDAAFLFPIVPEAAFGAELLELAEAGRTNLRGKPVSVRTVQTYPDALDMTKKAGPSAVVSVMTLAQGLPKMAANLRTAAQHGQALVVHVAGAQVTQDFELQSCAGAAYELTDAGAAVVVAAGVLDCVDSAIYAYVLAEALRRPVIHLVDGPLGLSARTSANLSWDSLTSRVHAMHRQLGSVRPGAGPPLELGDFRGLGYTGDRSAQTVFVAIGTAVSSARRAVESSGTHGLGLLEVQLLDPWHEDVSQPT
jgi:pyruvate/2-oxoacid:ferredoxin oxidoreductase alpha subunit